jgi:hypothetical protein
MREALASIPTHTHTHTHKITSCVLFFCLFVCFLVVLGFELRNLHLLDRCLSHASNPFGSGYFGDKGGLDWNPPILCFPP